MHTHIFVTYEIYHFEPSVTTQQSALIETAELIKKPFTLSEIEYYIRENCVIASPSIGKKPYVKRILSMQGITIPSLSQL